MADVLLRRRPEGAEVGADDPVEGLFRRDMSLKVKERILLAGAALIVLLMVTVIYNDIARLLR